MGLCYCQYKGIGPTRNLAIQNLNDCLKFYNKAPLSTGPNGLYTKGVKRDLFVQINKVRRDGKRIYQAYLI